MGQAGVENVRVAQANAPELLDNLLEESSVDELWVFFPDPGTRPAITSVV